MFDFAASRVARGKIHVAARDGEPIPADWAIDADGEPTTDPDAALAGSILPAADHKGLALAMMVEVLAGALTGARPMLSAGGAPGGVGAFGFVLDPGPLRGADAFTAGMSAWTDHYVRAVGRHGRIPGERAAAFRRAASHDGLAIPAQLERQMHGLAADTGTTFPGR